VVLNVLWLSATSTFVSTEGRYWKYYYHIYEINTSYLFIFIKILE